MPQVRLVLVPFGLLAAVQLCPLLYSEFLLYCRQNRGQKVFSMGL